MPETLMKETPMNMGNVKQERVGFQYGMGAYTYKHYLPPISHGFVYSMDCTYLNIKY